MSHSKTIQAFPALDMRKLFSRRTHADPILAHGRTRFYASGRAALFHAIKSLLIPPGAVVLLPSFNCGVEVEAVLRAGYKVDIYRIKKDLSIDVEHLISRICSRTKAIVIAHYFGFSQELAVLKDVCNRKGIILIEDCAHALYSQDINGSWLGTMGDLGLFSMRKTVFMPNGGAVLVNGKGFILPDRGRRSFNPAIFKLMIKSILEHEKNRGGDTAEISCRLLDFYQTHISSSARSAVPSTTRNERWYYDVPLFDYGNDISALSLLCSGRDDVREIIACRKRNYESLRDHLRARHVEGFVFPELPSGTCPLCLPLFVPQRDDVVARMSAQGIESYVFGRHPHPLVHIEEFPEVAFLSDSIVGLPIHQQIVPEDMEAVADAFVRSLER